MSNRRIIENISSNWANLAVTVAIAFLVSPVIVKSLGKELYGIWVLIVSVTGYFTVLDFGVNTAIIRYVSRSAAQKDYDGTRAVYSTSLAIFGIIALTILLFALVFGYFFQDFFRLYSLSRQYLYAVFMVSALDLACGLFFSVYLSVLGGLQDFKFINYSSIVINIIKSIILIIFLKYGYSIMMLALLQLFFNSLRALCQYIKIKLKYDYMVFKKKYIDIETIKSICDYSKYSFIIAIALKLLFYTDSVVIGALIGVSSVVFYAIPSSLLDYVEKFVWAMVAVLVPVISVNEANGNNAGNVRLYVVGTRYILLVSMPVVISLYYYGSDFIHIWMGPEIGERSKWVLKLLLIGFGISFSQLIAHGILKGISRHRILAYIMAAEALANLGMSMVLATSYGIEGVAVGTLVPLVLASVAITIYSCRVLKIKIWHYLYKAYSGALLGMLAAMVFVHLNPLPADSYLTIFVLSSCVTLCFLVVALPVALEKEHKEIITKKIYSIALQLLPF